MGGNDDTDADLEAIFSHSQAPNSLKPNQMFNKFISALLGDGIVGQTFLPTIMPTFMPTIPEFGDCCEIKLEHDGDGQVLDLYLLSQNVGDNAQAGCMDKCVYVK